MKRDPRLRQLSRDHHHALALARRATLAATDRNPGRLEDTWDEVVRRFDDELVPHFEIEERLLLPAMSAVGEGPLVERVLDDHLVIRDLVQPATVDLRKRSAEFGARLTEHVRFEERVLFPVAESKLTDKELEAIAMATPVPRTRMTPREEKQEDER